ncbi:UPF0561 protein C2orf68 homolog [Halichondria panicea]|uniref:UPF0561 protein C2orf68 homolog n=1 Tax=Halichondria panicea TaxID=6063 RepID=UPI00312BC32A
MSEDSDFPGLNKKHGFFKVIERNQKDRDDYHHKQEPIKQARSGAVKSERRPQRRPPAELYRPPIQKGEGLYCIEIEVVPGKWHQEVIEETGRGREVSRSISRQYRLDTVKQQAISELISEFESSLEL